MRLPGSFFWYVVGQVLAYALEVASFSAIFFLTAAPIWANVISKVVAACFAFAFHARISFAHQETKTLYSSASSYVLVFVLNAILTSSLLWILLRTTPIEPLYLKVFCDIVFVFVSFALIGKFVFPDGSQSALERATDQLVSRSDLPSFELPEAEPDDNGDDPLVSSDMYLEDHIAKLRERKRYED